MYKIVLRGNPISTNNLYLTRGGGRGRFMKKKPKLLKESYILQAKRQRNHGIFESKLDIYIHIYFGDKRQRDWDNYNKLMVDALEGIVFKNDVQIMRGTVEKDYDKVDPRAEIFIKLWK